MKRAKSTVRVCPICKARQPQRAARCSHCGAALTGPGGSAPDTPKLGGSAPSIRHARRTRLDGPTTSAWDLGEADLHEGLLPRLPLSGVAAALLVVAILLVAGLYVMPRISATPPPDSTSSVVAGAAPRTRQAPLPTNTRMLVLPTAAYATTTSLPPTATETPEPGPCIVTATAGDTLYGLASRCGHRDMAVVDAILRLNSMESAESLQVGQELQIPWPTPTGGGIAVEEEPGLPAADSADSMGEEALPPGLMWYTVESGETALSIVAERDITMRILRDVNPEVLFEGCDFGMPSGGPECSVMLYEGQRLRVPAPEASPSPSPTLTGSETATPLPSPTFNAPFSISPSDRMLFESFEVPTLRWTASGALAGDEVYLLSIEDRTGGIIYNVPTRDLSYQMPAEWQPIDGRRHEFAWTVVVATVVEGTTVVPSTFATETRTFIWLSR